MAAPLSTPPTDTTSDPRDTLAGELSEMSDSARVDFVRTLLWQWERISDMHGEACDAAEKALADAATWKARYEQALNLLNAIAQTAAKR